ncbi:GMC family oxidoreductase [Bdellovibrio sp. 22V]|uniref:GMC oxidoreductase n=1 Tax=Bdellovibrio sp. 22V TaxID=3044166 RepID=UPI002543FA1A|nr:GMC family oxidoreductase [Bdellovibrio sp. 22V]WII70870.1 GMC family oxidoreductase [Bdellovibrio sp. 22V]
MIDCDYDYIVIGSGFGGSVMTCRLAEKGYKVLLLERGRQWKMHEFPRRPHEIQQNMFWDPEDNKFGLMEFLDNPESDAISLTASGLGGGSLIYANVLYKMPAENFHAWPGGFTREKLEPYYDKVLATMEAKPYPFETESFYHHTPKTSTLKRLATELPVSDEENEPPKFVLPPLAVRFEGAYPGEQTKNIHGATQSKCTKCGECDLGCNIHAKNTLDLNYLYRAQHLKTKAEVRTHAEVQRIEYIDGVYKVTYVIPQMPEHEISFTAKNVIVAAGSVGSTSLLLKMKKEGYLPRLNSWLGKKWCGNGDLLGIVLDSEENLDPTNGPVITGALQYSFKNYPDGFAHNMVVEDAGFPIGMAWYLSGKIPQLRGLGGTLKLIAKNLRDYLYKILRLKNPRKELNIGDDFATAIDRADFVRRAFVLLGMGRDRPDGEISLRSDNKAVIRWKLEKSELHYDRLRRAMKNIADKVGGVFMDNPLTHLDKVIAVHPLGGCPMGNTSEDGFVSPQGKVFGYDGLYVVDGSIIPTSIGPNPSLTIAALAEYISEQIPAKDSILKKATELA